MIRLGATAAVCLLAYKGIKTNGTFYRTKEHFIRNEPTSKWACFFFGGYRIEQTPSPFASTDQYIRLSTVTPGFLRDKYAGSVYFEERSDYTLISNIYLRDMYEMGSGKILSRLLDIVLDQCKDRKIVARTLRYSQVVSLYLSRGFETERSGPNAYSEFVRMQTDRAL